MFAPAPPPLNTTASDSGAALRALPKHRKNHAGVAVLQAAGYLNGIEAAALTAVVEMTLTPRFQLNAIRWYADNYHSFAGYGGHAGTGKVMGQSLDEAVWCRTPLNALFIIDFDGESDEGKRLYKSLFMPLSQLVIKQTRAIQNIALWHCAAAVGAAVLFRNNALLKQALNGRHGARAQISEGFSMDGLWFETPAYHYALEAATRQYYHADKSGRFIFDRLIKHGRSMKGLHSKRRSGIDQRRGTSKPSFPSRSDPRGMGAHTAPRFSCASSYCEYDKPPVCRRFYGIPSGGQKPENNRCCCRRTRCILRSKGGAADVFASTATCQKPRPPRRPFNLNIPVLHGRRHLGLRFKTAPRMVHKNPFPFNRCG